MHSSRMRTAHCSSRLGGGGGIFLKGCLPRGDVCLGAGCLPNGGVCLGRHLPQTQKQTPPWTQRQTPLPVNRITDRCENIAFPQLLLWTVKIYFSSCSHPSREDAVVYWIPTNLLQLRVCFVFGQSTICQQVIPKIVSKSNDKYGSNCNGGFS